MLVVAIGLQIIFAWMFMRDLGWVGNGLHEKYDRNIAVLLIDQEITDPYINTIIGQLEHIKENKEKFPHLLIMISSPGGSPVGSSELMQYLIDFQKEIPTTFYIQNMSVSGSYYLAMASHYDPKNKLSGLIANDCAIVGSIGVIMPHMVIKGMADKVGVEEDDIVAGKFKKPISMFKRTSDEDKLYLSNNLLNPVYRHFVEAVARRRRMSTSEVEQYAQGKLFVSTEVLHKLVDRISYIGEIKKEVKESVQKRFPRDEVGFVQIDLSGKQKGLFEVKVSIDGASLGENISQDTQSRPITFK
jgi:protease-4